MNKKGIANKKINGFMFDYVRQAKPNSYGGLRPLSRIEGIALHWTGGDRDTAKNECDFFATGNTISAGAHLFISRDGTTGFSIPLRRTAWSVMSKGYQQGVYYGILDNTNTVSIELCACRDSQTDTPLSMSAEQEKALIKLCRWIKKKCPNCKHFVRHYDVVKKPCPQYYVEHKEDWEKLKKHIEENYLRG